MADIPPSMASAKTAGSAMSTRSKTRLSRAQNTPRTASDRVPTSLLSLPQELIADIISHSHVPAALSLARVSPILTAIAEQKIWHTVNAALPGGYGAKPSDGLEKSETAREAEAALQVVERRYRVAVNKRVKQILRSGNARRLGMVREVKIAPRKNVMSDTIRLLARVAPHLQRLEVEGCRWYDYNGYPRFWYLSDVETFDYRFSGAGIYFPCLTHARFAHGPVRSSAFVQTLLAAAPLLKHLDINLEDTSWGYTELDDYQPPAVSEVPTKLRYLRVPCYEDGEEDTPAKPLLAILRRSPDLEQVAIDYCEDDVGVFDLMAVLCGLAKLRDLCWIICPEVFCREYRSLSSSTAAKFPALRRLILYYSEEVMMFPQLPPIATMEEFYLASSDLSESYTYPLVRSTSVTTPPPSFVQKIRDCPQISKFYHVRAERNRPVDFDALDEHRLSVKLAGIFTTLHHHAREVLSFRLLSWRYETSDRPIDDVDVDDTPWDERADDITYTAGDGMARVKHFRYHSGSGALWLALSDYEGFAVPLQVISEMREAQGASEEAWTGRGVEVGDEAWKVLTDWKEKL